MIDPKIARTLRRVYSTPDGQIALQFLLTTMGYFDVNEKIEIERAALRNYASRLVEWLGFTDKTYVGDFKKPRFVQALMKGLPYPEKGKKRYAVDRKRKEDFS